MFKSKPIDMLGILDPQRVTQLSSIRDKAQSMWARGLVNHPDFTLHGIQHSETIIRIIANLMDALKDNAIFNETERFLVGASAYLHDIGMLIDLEGFLEERLAQTTSVQESEEEQRRSLLINFAQSYEEEQYVRELFDNENPVEPRHTRDAELIREMHHLFSDFLIQKFKDHFNISEGHEYLFIAPISRGHRRSDLNRQEYDTTNLNGEIVRTGVLAAFLRIADELDYSSKRIPEIHFTMYEHRLRREAISLKHWIKHFYITSTGNVARCIREDPEGLVTPVFEIRGMVPDEDYKELLLRHVEKSRGVIDSPGVRRRLEEVKASLPRIDDSGIVIRPHAKPIPGSIGSELRAKGLSDFLRELKCVQVLLHMSQPTVSVIDNPPDPEQIARAIGYQRDYFGIIYDWFDKEVCKLSFVYEIKASEKISFVTSLFDNEEPLDCIGRCRIQSLTPGHEVTCKPTIRQGGKQRVYGAKISPPLESDGNTFKYVITERFKNLLAFTKEDLERKSKLYPPSVPLGMEAIYAAIVIPSARVVLRVIFPPHYKIENKQFKVTIIDSTIQCPDEISRVKKSRFYKSGLKRRDGRVYLELDVIEPRLLRSYMLMWSPVDN